MTYEPPAKMQDFLLGNGERNHINTYLSKIYDLVEFKDWFFGKLHMHKLIPPKYHAVYDGIVVADSTVIKKKKEPKEVKKPENHGSPAPEDTENEKQEETQSKQQEEN